MTGNLRAEPVKGHEINGGVFELKKNTPKLIGKENNPHTAHIREETEDEDCFIHSHFRDEAFAIICKEFYLNFYKDPKRVDLSYYYFSEDKNAAAYLYDMKKTFAGLDVIIHLVEQWKSSICDAKYCVDKTETYQLAYPGIHIGVITEHNDTERRRRELQPILHPEPIPEDLPSFIKSKRRANTADRISKAKILDGFDEGKVTIGGITYDYDVRTFIDKEHHMYFKDGVLEQQTVE